MTKLKTSWRRKKIYVILRYLFKFYIEYGRTQLKMYVCTYLHLSVPYLRKNLFSEIHESVIYLTIRLPVPKITMHLYLVLVPYHGSPIILCTIYILYVCETSVVCKQGKKYSTVVTNYSNTLQSTTSIVVPVLLFLKKNSSYELHR